MYRDEIGAALERLEKLEEENALLRAELERRRGPAPPFTSAARARSIGACAMLTGVAFAMIVGMLAARSDSSRCHTRMRNVHAVGPQRTLSTVDVRSRSGSGDDCLIPYWFDANNVKRYKPQCLNGNP
jgi:hypothetical protein